VIHAERNAIETTKATSNFLLVGFPLLPLGILVRKVQKFNFLQIGRQSNLIYAVVLAFVALLYLSLVRRISQWFEPAFPPEATAAVLLFLPVVFFEPLQRAFRTSLRKTAHNEMDLTQRMMGPIQDVARLGSFAKLAQFVEQWAKSQFQLAKVELLIGAAAGQRGGSAGSGGGAVDTFAIQQGNRTVGCLRVTSHGAMLSGETWAALEFLCEQLPSAFDLCRLIEEKLRLERELAERERMAALGQMAASISHNLKNPLGSIKTILQVQLESPEMPEALKAETRMVLGEISRLSNKLGQLLQFSRPTVLGDSDADFTLDEVVNEVGAVMRPEAERKGITLEVAAEKGLHAAASREAVSDIVSNLVVNGLEAASGGGRVMVSLAQSDGQGLICVQDDGKGIPVELREKVMQPFFTTKTQGTGLGLAIVARRVSEAAGKLELESPAANGHGTRFSVWLPLREEKQ
jgi:signal transduction histidine kinase